MTKNILGFAGSLRSNSYNKLLLETACKLAPEGMEIELFDLAGIPLFNQDNELDMPSRVLEFKQKIESADGILIATPEYNYSIPGVLKNAMDWASRPQGSNSFAGKPVAVMGATPYALGTSRAQYHLRQTFVFLDMHQLNKPEIMVPFVADKFDEVGELADNPTREKVSNFLVAYLALVQKF